MANKKLLGVHEIPAGSELQIKQSSASSESGYKFALMNSDGKLMKDAVDGGAVRGADIQADAIDSQHYAAGSIDAEHLASSSVEGAKLHSDLIGDQTALGAAPADGDQLLLSDVTASSSSTDVSSLLSTSSTVNTSTSYVDYAGSEDGSSFSGGDVITFTASNGDFLKFTVVAWHSSGGSYLSLSYTSSSGDASGTYTGTTYMTWSTASKGGSSESHALKKVSISNLRAAMSSGLIVAGDGLDASVNSSTGATTVSLDLLAAGALEISGADNELAIKLHESNAGDSGLEISADGLRIKAGEVTNAMLEGSIDDSKLNQLSTAGKVALSALEVDGESNQVTALADADLFIVDDGAAGTNSKMAASVIKAYGRESLSASDAGGDGSFAYDSSTGVFTYTGPSSAEVRAHLSGGTGVTYNSSTGVIAIGQAVETTSDVQFNDIQADGNVIISGNLTVNGSQNVIEADTVQIKDTLLDMGMEDDGNGGLQIPSSESTKDQGFVFNRKVGSNNTKTALFWDESADKFRMATGVSETDGVLSSGNLATLQANLEGNASTATALETARDFALSGDVAATAVSFDATGNVTLTTVIQSGAVELSMMAANSVDSDQYVDGSIDTIHIADSQITLAKMAANSVDSDQYVDGSIDTAHIADSQITLAKMAVNSIDSDQYVDGSIDREHLAADIVDGTKIADAAVDSEHIANGAIDLAHMSVNSVDSDQYVDGSIDLEHFANGSTAGQLFAWSGSAWVLQRPSIMVEFDVSFDASGDGTLDASQASWVSQASSGADIKIELSNSALYGTQAVSMPYFMAQVFVETSSGVKELAGTNMSVDVSDSSNCYVSFDLDGAAVSSSAVKIFIGFSLMGALVQA